MTSARIRSFSGVYFPAFGLNTGIRTEYVFGLSISPYLVQMRENTDQKNPEYGHFERNVRK